MSCLSVYYINYDTNMSFDAIEYNNYFLCDATIGNVNIILPADKIDGTYYEFNRMDTLNNNNITLLPPNNETINGGASINIGVYEYAYALKYGSDWIISVITFRK